MPSALLPAPSCSTSSCCLTSIPGSPRTLRSGRLASRAFAELLIHCGEDRGAASVLVGMLRDRAIEPAPHGEPGGLAQTRIAQRAALAGSQT
jgi:hypothetical protein